MNIFQKNSELKEISFIKDNDGFIIYAGFSNNTDSLEWTQLSIKRTALALGGVASAAL